MGIRTTVLLLFVNLISYRGYSQSTNAELRNCLLKTAWSQVGVIEVGNNGGPVVDIYLRSVGLKTGFPWCAALQCWCLKQHCLDNPSSGAAAAFFPKTKIIDPIKTKPRPTDYFGIYFKDLGGIHHVGMIISWGSTWIDTIEGNTAGDNTGSKTRNGGECLHKRRLKSQVYKVSRWVN